MNDRALPSVTAYRPVRAPRGLALSCHGWRQEGALRMLMNSLDPDVAEQPEEFMACTAAGRVAASADSFETILASLREATDDATVLIQSGRVASRFRTNDEAPSVAISGATWGYAGTQGMLATAYELFAAAARKHFGGTLAGRLVVCSGMGGTGGAHPLAATASGAAFLGIDADLERIKRRVKSGFCDLAVNDLNEALRILKNAVRKREPASVGLIGNGADVLPQLARRGVVPDLLTDQTSADDPGVGYLPRGLTRREAHELRRRDTEAYRRRALDSVAEQVRAMLELQRLGSVAFEFGNHIRAQGQAAGVEGTEKIADGAAEYIRPLQAGGRTPLLWVALSGEAADIARADSLAIELSGGDDDARVPLALAGQLRRFQGLPARACWLERRGQSRFAGGLNELVGRGELKGPAALAWDAIYEGTGESRSGEREEESGAGDAGWPQISGALEASPGASWVVLGKDTRGRRRRTGWGAVADGTPAATSRIEGLLRREGDGAGA